MVSVISDIQIFRFKIVCCTFILVANGRALGQIIRRFIRIQLDSQRDIRFVFIPALRKNDFF